MEETGVGRKSERDFTPKQKRSISPKQKLSISPNFIDRSSEVTTTITQHFASEISSFTEQVFLLLCICNLFQAKLMSILGRIVTSKNDVYFALRIKLEQ
jgi:hypothetical protein